MSKQYFSKEYVALRLVLAVTGFVLLNITWIYISSTHDGGLAALAGQKGMLSRLLLGFLETFVLVELAFNIVWKVTDRKPHITGFQSFFAVLSSIVAIAVFSFFFCLIDGFELSYFIRNLISDMALTLAVATVFYIVIQGNRMNELLEERAMILEEKARLAEANAIAQADAMNMRIDNHFFFNSLNVLASLIEEDSEKAESFLFELSDTYRTILTLGSEATIPIKDELKLVKSYMKMSGYRFGEESIKLNIDHTLEDNSFRQIIPLSIMETVGNAIKHNSYSPEHPLKIDAGYEKEEDGTAYVVVVNNKQDKISMPFSTKQGLENIKKKYRLVSDQNPIVEDAEDKFTIKLPIIEKWTY